MPDLEPDAEQSTVIHPAHVLMIRELMAEIRAEGILRPAVRPDVPSERPIGTCAICGGPVELVEDEDTYVRHLQLADLGEVHQPVWRDA